MGSVWSHFSVAASARTVFALVALLVVIGSAGSVLGGLQQTQSDRTEAPQRSAAGSGQETKRQEQRQNRARIRVKSPAFCYSSSNDHGFLGKPERVILDKLANGAVAKVRRGKIGRSVAFKITLRDGTRGYYKPEQTFSSANWYAEVVAFYLDRALKLGRVPPVVSRRLPWSRLRRSSQNKTRFDEVKVAEDGTVRGAFIWWLPKRLRELRTDAGWENWIRIESWQQWRITPFQRPKLYTDELNAWRANKGNPPRLYFETVPEPDTAQRAAEISDMIVFDYLTLNIDRWGGDNSNVLTHGKGGPLIFLDNGAGFSPGPPRRGLMDDRLRVLQRFRKSTIEALRGFDIDRFAELLARDSLAPLLDDSDLKGLEIRRQAVLQHVDALQAKSGDAVYEW